MSSSQIKYNPGIRGDQELIRSFVARKVELGLALETLRENAESRESSNQHLLFVGPRGAGKTMLVRRVAAEVRAVQELSTRWYPIVFAEEPYQVCSPGEFWLEALFHLADQTGDERWARAYQELKLEQDEVRLRQRAISHLLDFADQKGNRILLIVESLNKLLGEQIQGNAHWDLRHTLQNERRIMLLGTATTRFEEIENIDKAWFEMFAIHDLRPLDHQDCMDLWRSVTASEPHPQRVRAVQILTGGNPRLLTILAEFAANRSFRELMDHLIQLVDDHTEYFRSHLDNLPAAERKVFVTLLDRWDAVTARQVAQAARMGVNSVSVQLNRLVSRGAVVIVQQEPRRKLYQAAERLYNIYYLMRRRGHPSTRVRAAVDFMLHFYEGEELVKTTVDLAREACGLSPEQRQDHFLAYTAILTRASRADMRRSILEATPEAFFEAPDVLEILRQLPRLLPAEEPARAGLGDVLEPGNRLLEQGRFQEAELAYRKALVTDPHAAETWVHLGVLLHEKLERPLEAEQAYRKAIELKPNFAGAWAVLGRLLHEKLGRPEEAEQAYRRAIELKPGVFWGWALLGLLLHEKLERPEEAEQAYRKALEVEPRSAGVWGQLGVLLHTRLGRLEEAEQAYCHAIELKPESAGPLALPGLLLHGTPWRSEEAEQACRKTIERWPDCAGAWTWLGELQEDQEKYLEAQEAYLKVVRLKPDDDWAPIRLGCLIRRRLDRGDDAHAVIQQAQEFLDRGGRDAKALNSVAIASYQARLVSCLPQAESWAREAVEKDRTWNHVRTLVCILGAQGKWEEALTEAAPLLDAAATEKQAARHATEFLIDAAAAHAQRAFEVLTASAGAAALEPLGAGLRIFLGETPLIAQEIFEIGQDVAQRIRERQAARSKQPTLSAARPVSPRTR